MNNQLQFRFVLDCETLEKVLQYRYAIDNNTVTEWQSVPTSLGVIRNGQVEMVYGDKK